MYKIKRNGFTLVELMAVIIIISLIALLTFPNIVNQIKRTKKSNNKMVEDVVISQAKKYVSDNPNDFEDDEYCLPIDTLLNNDYVKEELVKDLNNKVIHLTLDDNKYEVVDKDKCVLSAVKYLLKKTNPKSITNYTDGDIHEMYTFEHEATEQTPALTDYRYIGSDPNNYVEFNNELWRIIGIFKVEDENGNWEERIKIVRNEKINDVVWDTSRSNDWVNSTLNNNLNNEYYNSLNNDSKKMIKESKYYLGGISTNDIYSANNLYNLERGKKVYSGRSINIVNKVGLFYSSDYLYTYALGIDDTCYADAANCNQSRKSWLGYDPSKYNITQWTISPYSAVKWRAYFIEYNGKINQNHTNNKFYYRPTLYLSSKVKITSGDGSIDNAYKLSM